MPRTQPRSTGGWSTPPRRLRSEQRDNRRGRTSGTKRREHAREDPTRNEKTARGRGREGKTVTNGFSRSGGVWGMGCHVSCNGGLAIFTHCVRRERERERDSRNCTEGNGYRLCDIPFHSCCTRFTVYHFLLLYIHRPWCTGDGQIYPRTFSVSTDGVEHHDEQQARPPKALAIT